MSGLNSKFYAVRHGRVTGIFMTWMDCEKQIKGFRGAQFKKFSTRIDAERYVNQSSLTASKKSLKYDIVNPRQIKRRRTNLSPLCVPNNTIIVYTDGACRNNGTDIAVGGIGVYFGPSDPRNASEPLLGRQTNQRAELQAVIRALEIIVSHRRGSRESVEIRTDSSYVQKGITKWIHGWKKNNWRTASQKPVKNKDLWITLDHLVTKVNRAIFVHVKAHSGIEGNEQADRLAVDGCTRRPIH